jgi:hypothetical protein
MDYGFSKTLEEAGTKWGRQQVLGDMVRIIRQYRPLVVASRFSGTPADGHGQHQLAGALTPAAFAAAADASQFPEQIEEGLRPWQAKKLYVAQGFRPDPAVPVTTEIATGRLDAVIGRTYSEVASEGRSQHKSQEMGTLELMGPQRSALRLVRDSAAEPAPGTKETSLFAGLDTTVPGLAALAGLPVGALQSELAAMDEAGREAARSYDARTPAAIVPALARGLTATRAARAATGTLTTATADARADADFLLALKERDYVEALAAASGITLDPLANAETVTPGDALSVNVRAFVAEPGAAALGAPRVTAPQGWTVTVEAAVEEDASPFARFFRETPTSATVFRAEAPADSPATQPYWLEGPRKGDVFDWPAASPKRFAAVRRSCQPSPWGSTHVSW